jgi:MFS family permease
MTRLLYPFLALLLSLSVLLLGSGMLGTLLALRMELEQFGTTTIGVVMACYSIGYVMASLWFGRIIMRIGHIRAFAVLAALAAGSTLIYPLLIHPIPWAVMRTVLGFAVAGLYMVAESWLNGRTPREYRGRVLAFYSIATYAALGGGQFLLNLWPVDSFHLFSLSALLLAVSLIPVAMTRAPSPELIEARPVDVRRLYVISPLGAIGSLAAGIMAGGFMALGPVFGRQVGLSVAEVSVLMGAGVLGGLLFQWPLGRMSDRHSRRLTIVSVAAGVAATSVLLALVAPRSELGLVVLASLWGGLAFTLYPLCLALANDFIGPDELIGAGAGLLLMHGVGMIIGPVAMGRLMEWLGPSSLFASIALVALLLALFGLWRQRVGAPLSVADQGHYVVVPSTTAFAATLDPRAEEPQMELPFDGTDSYAAVVLHKGEFQDEHLMEERRGQDSRD